MEIKAHVMLDAIGLACPMPIVRTKKSMSSLEAGQVLEVQATDKGSRADIQAWALSAGHHYLGTIEEGGLLKHYLRKSSGAEQAELRHAAVVNHDQLEQLLKDESGKLVLDVRESAEYAFSHIRNSVSIPLGELEQRLDELNKKADIYVICRSGHRSDMAAQKLTASGFKHVYNVVPGMSQWTGLSAGLN